MKGSENEQITLPLMLSRFPGGHSIPPSDPPPTPVLTMSRFSQPPSLFSLLLRNLRVMRERARQEFRDNREFFIGFVGGGVVGMCYLCYCRGRARGIDRGGDESSNSNSNSSTTQNTAATTSTARTDTARTDTATTDTATTGTARTDTATTDTNTTAIPTQTTRTRGYTGVGHRMVTDSILEEDLLKRNRKGSVTTMTNAEHHSLLQTFIRDHRGRVKSREVIKQIEKQSQSKSQKI